MNAVEDADEVDADDAHDVLERDFVEEAADADAGVVVEDVHLAAGGGAEFGERFFVVGLVGDVELAHDAVVDAEFLFECAESVGVNVIAADEPSFLAEQTRGLAAHPGCGAGDEDRFAAVGSSHRILSRMSLLQIEHSRNSKRLVT